MLPELLGEDERTVGLGNALLEGVPRLTGLFGPALAGVLIALFDAPSVLYIDAATFVFSALVLTFLVPARPPVEPTDEARGLLAGVRFLFRDRLLGPLAGCAMVLNALGQMLVAALPVLAYEQYDGSSRVAGAFFASVGAGAVIGMLVALRLMPRYDPIRLASVSLVALTLPIWLLLADLPAWGVVAALFLSALFGPLVNAPLIGVITTRTPEALRPKVMTAVITFAMLAGPIGLLVAGPLLQQVGAQPVFGLIAAGELVAALVFAAVALRHHEPPVALADAAVEPG
jgi:fucose permease